MTLDEEQFHHHLHTLNGLRKRRDELTSEELLTIEPDRSDPNSSYGAVFLYLKAAVKANYLPAFFPLGLMYRWGEGVQSSWRRAFTVFKNGAAAGNARCALECGECLSRSNMGASVDYQLAYKYFVQAASGGMPYACERLGWAFFQGDMDCPLHYPTAHHWFKQAEQLGSVVGARMCVTIVEKFDTSIGVG